VRDHRDDEHRADHADRREQTGRRARAPQRVDRSIQAAIEQDERERRRPRAEREAVVVEHDVADPVASRDDPDREEDETDRQPQSLRCMTQQRTRGEQQRDHGEEDRRRVRFVRQRLHRPGGRLNHPHLGKGFAKRGSAKVLALPRAG
jgi:hypothetical protein